MASMRQTLSQQLAGARDPRTRGKLTFAALTARAPMLASVVLGLAIAAQAAAIALSLSAESGAGSGIRSAVPIGARVRVRASGEVRLEEIAAAHLFGVAPQEMTAVDARAVSRSALVLTGIIATADPREGFAIIGASPTRSRAIYVGSEAAPGTVLTEVHPQWVVLQRNGRRLTLRLPTKELTAGGSVNFLRREDSGPGAATADDSAGGETFATASRFSPPPLSDSATIVRAFALRLADVDGQQGERIGGTGLNRKVLASLGLSPGDVITQINGVPVGAANAPNLLSAIQSGSATLLVVKNGEAASVTLDSGSVASAATLYREVAPE